MELKDVILSTLAEMDETAGETPNQEVPELAKDVTSSEADTLEEILNAGVGRADAEFIEEERLFLERLRERLLVLFEGFQSPNNKAVEAKIDLTLNFLEYLLATLDERIETLKRS
ncbi:hypothetical protein [Hydrogenimonas sp. SS33]|uniref:CiaD-like domain-containing protein n=1 Tax=Hydrogenimonas leucolamina TaxID=2954236 RepID=UPI00336BDA6E